MAHLFTVWSRHRDKKALIIVGEGPDLLQRLILKGIGNI